MVCLHRKEKIKTTCTQNYLLSNASKETKSSVSLSLVLYEHLIKLVVKTIGDYMTNAELLINIIGSGVVLLGAVILLYSCVRVFGKQCNEDSTKK